MGSLFIKNLNSSAKWQNVVFFFKVTLPRSFAQPKTTTTRTTPIYAHFYPFHLSLSWMAEDASGNMILLILSVLSFNVA